MKPLIKKCYNWGRTRLYIGNVEDSPRLVFMDEESGNLIVLYDGGELTRNVTALKMDCITKALNG